MSVTETRGLCNEIMSSTPSARLRVVPDELDPPGFFIDPTLGS